MILRRVSFKIIQKEIGKNWEELGSNKEHLVRKILTIHELSEMVCWKMISFRQIIFQFCLKDSERGTNEVSENEWMR